MHRKQGRKIISGKEIKIYKFTDNDFITEIHKKSEISSGQKLM